MNPSAPAIFKKDLIILLFCQISVGGLQQLPEILGHCNAIDEMIPSGGSAQLWHLQVQASSGADVGQTEIR